MGGALGFRHTVPSQTNLPVGTSFGIRPLRAGEGGGRVGAAVVIVEQKTPNTQVGVLMNSKTVAGERFFDNHVRRWPSPPSLTFGSRSQLTRTTNSGYYKRRMGFTITYIQGDISSRRPPSRTFKGSVQRYRIHLLRVCA